MAHYVVEVDAETGLLVHEGEWIEAGQPIGKTIGRDGVKVAYADGEVRLIQLLPDTQSLLVYIWVPADRTARQIVPDTACLAS